MLLTLELTLAGLMLVVFVLGLLWGPARRREIGAVTAAGLVALFVLSLVLDSGGALFDGAYVLDGLARFFKLGRYSPGMASLAAALAAERKALYACFVILIGVMLVAISLYLWFVNRGRRTRDVSLV